MIKIKPRFDVSFWNLDGLELRGPINSKGKINFVALQDELTADDRVTFSHSGEVLLLRPKDRILQSINKETNEASVVFNWQKGIEYVDLAVSNTYIYLLSSNYQRIDCFIKQMGFLENIGSWTVGTHLLSSSSRIVVPSTIELQPEVAFISTNGRILAVSLVAGIDTRELEVKVPTGMKMLGPNIYLCADPQNNTLIVADTLNHRVLEVSYATGTVEVISGVGYPGNSEDGKVARNAALNSPRGVAVYRPVVSPGLLTGEALTYLKLDPSRVRPRTILIADSENLRVKKVLDIPLLAADTNSVSAKPHLYTLIGSGRSPQIEPEKVSARAQRLMQKEVKSIPKISRTRLESDRRAIEEREYELKRSSRGDKWRIDEELRQLAQKKEEINQLLKRPPHKSNVTVSAKSFDANLPTTENETDLRTYPIQRPHEISVSNSGEVLVHPERGKILILLQPATALGEELAYKQGREEKSDET